MPLSKRAAAEFVGTFWLVFGGCGAAVIAAHSRLGIGLFGVALAFGLTVLTMAFAIGHISGCHLNPGRLRRVGRRQAIPSLGLTAYVCAGAGGDPGAGVLYVIASGKEGFSLGGFASNGYDEHSPGGYSQAAAWSPRSC